ncbi:PREDICTED: SAFB-like transcription modulator [Branchiostoma belcheri]|uniref:SAFB-like transcription modulator n=1 Tax=Branchiostoma belcheri TaxID=7741 RepID=A0A6P4ZAZ6_BRABE|nr:PREDICTED: SAFB-like transcription modulator [Branchiostoma belcheri]
MLTCLPGKEAEGRKRARELEKLRLEAERLKIEAEEKDKERQIEIEKLKFEAERLKVENEEKERKRQIEMEKLKLESEEREKAREAAEREKEAERKHQLEMKKLEAEMAAVGPPTAEQATAKAPRLPAFVDEKDDLDAYLLRFEIFAASSQWAEDKWAAHLSALLTGRALEVYSRLPEDEARSYTAVKQALLKRYNLTEEGFRAKFRQNKAEEGESPQQFIVRLTSYVYLERWVELAESSKSYEGLRDLFVKEQFLEACPRDLAVRLREQGPSSLDELAGMAQHYLEAHERELGKKEEEKETIPVRNRTQLGTASGIATCYTCGDPSHFARDCPVSKEARPTGASSIFTSTGGKAGQQATFIVAGQVEGKKVPLLLDTGSTQTLIREDLVDAGKIAEDQEITEKPRLLDCSTAAPPEN